MQFNLATGEYGHKYVITSAWNIYFFSSILPKPVLRSRYYFFFLHSSPVHYTTSS